MSTRTLGSVAVVTILAATVLVPSPVQASRTATTSPEVGGCTIEELPLPAGMEEGRVTGGDPKGRYLVGVVQSFINPETPAVWHDGTVTMYDLGYVNGQTITDAAPDGTFVGTGVNGGGARGFVILPDGELIELGGGSNAAAIDKDGTVVGSVGGSGQYRPAVWRAGRYDKPPTILESEPDSSTRLIDIAQGRAVGTRFQPSLSRSFVWGRGGQQHPLPGTDDNARNSVVRAAGNWAVGTQENFETEEFTVLRWQLKSRSVEQVDVPQMFANSINRHGVIGGSDGLAAVLVVGNDVVALPPLVEGESAIVEHVTSSGDAAGWAFVDDDGTSRPVRWHCD